MESEFDLLPLGKKNDLFRVTFDVYTARPHFILLPKFGNKLPKDHSLKAEEKNQLIEAASDMCSSKIDCGTLSIHRGSWISKTTHGAHFHLCVDTMKYLEILQPVANKVLVNCKFDKYAEMAKFYSKSYHAEDVNDIQKIIKSGGLLAERKKTIENCFHPKHPKIGFLGKTTMEYFKNILIQMEKYAGTNLLDKEGFHLCLNFGSGSDSEWNLPEALPEGVGVAGYILVSGPRFYQLCPEESREAWFEAFKKSKFKVET